MFFVPLIVAKTVYVTAYWRFRYGRWESVRQHWRRPPT